MADPFARNPALDDLRERVPAVVAIALREGPPPTLFPSGDVPPYVASGNPPAELLKLPWKLRRAAAKASAREWARLFNEYSKGIVGADAMAELDPAANDPANGEYLALVSSWASGFTHAAAGLRP